MGTALGGGWSGTPPTFNLFGKAFFTVARSARKIFLGPFKSPENPFWGTSELSDVKIFFGAPRQSGTKTLFILILGKRGQNLVFGHFWREAPKEKFFENFGPKSLDFGSMGRRPRGGGYFRA